MISVYVAGPMTKGDLLQHVRDAVHAADKIWAAGAIPYVPQVGILYQLISPHTYEDWMQLDFAWLDKCDAVLRMPGESSGADREVQRARFNGQPVFYSVESLLAWVTEQRDQIVPVLCGAV